MQQLGGGVLSYQFVGKGAGGPGLLECRNGLGAMSGAQAHVNMTVRILAE